MSTYTNDRKYTKEHEWAKLDSSGKILEIGVTEHAQISLGDVVFVELPEVGKELKAGDTFGVVESIKAVSDLYSPASGKISEINEKLNDEPATINSDAHGKGWLVKIEISDASELDSLMDASAYQKFVDE